MDTKADCKGGRDRVVTVGFVIYFVIELLLLAAVEYLQPRTAEAVYGSVEYAAIVVNFIVTAAVFMCCGRQSADRHSRLIALGLTVNLVADTFLCLLSGLLDGAAGETADLVGFAMFCVVELIYAAYIFPKAKKGRVADIAARCLLYALFLVALSKLEMLTLANAVAALNLSLLAVNLVGSWRYYARERNATHLLFALGITLFFGCDYSILVRTLTDGTAIYPIIRDLVWVFYIPAQVLLVTSYKRSTIQ